MQQSINSRECEKFWSRPRLERAAAARVFQHQRGHGGLAPAWRNSGGDRRHRAAQTGRAASNGRFRAKQSPLTEVTECDVLRDMSSTPVFAEVAAALTRSLHTQVSPEPARSARGGSINASYRWESSSG